MHYDGFTPDFMTVGKATGQAMVLANMDSWACIKLPYCTVTTAPAERLLRCVHLMEAIFSDNTSPYIDIASQIPEYHTCIRDAIQACMDAEEARQQAWQQASPGEHVQDLEVLPDVWARFRAAADSRGDRVRAVWGGNLLWGSVAAARLSDRRGGPGNALRLGSSSRPGWGTRPTTCGPSSRSIPPSPT